MAIVNPTNVGEVCFDRDDLEILSQKEISKSYIQKIQQAFFPRLKLLVESAITEVEKVYGLNPNEKMSLVFHPNPRKSTENPKINLHGITVGISGKRKTSRSLTVKRKSGKPYFFHRAWLSFTIDFDGFIGIDLILGDVDRESTAVISTLFLENVGTLSKVFERGYITYNENEKPLQEILSSNYIEERGVFVYSLGNKFPVDFDSGIYDQIISFIALYPLIDSLIDMGEGNAPNLPSLLNKFLSWCDENKISEVENELEDDEMTETLPDIDEMSISVQEGSKHWRTHLRRERNPKIVQAKKAHVLQQTNQLACEACGFDFMSFYGEIGDGFCEAHHIKPLAEATQVAETSLADLAILCSNCHRMIHRTKPMISISELRQLITERKREN